MAGGSKGAVADLSPRESLGAEGGWQNETNGRAAVHGKTVITAYRLSQLHPQKLIKGVFFCLGIKDGMDEEICRNYLRLLQP